MYTPLTLEGEGEAGESDSEAEGATSDAEDSTSLVPLREDAAVTFSQHNGEVMKFTDYVCMYVCMYVQSLCLVCVWTVLGH